MLSLDDLKARARRGDADALRELRDRGFFGAKGRRVAYPLSDAQRRLWVLDQMNPDASAYNVPGAIRLHGALDTEVFERALTALIERHESLRTGFSSVDGEPRQVVDPNATLVLARIDLRNVDDPLTAARAYITADAARPFSLAHPPLMRAALLTLGTADHVFAFNLHHIVCDGWSLGVLFRDLLGLYDAFVSGAGNPLAPLRIQYKDVAAWQRQRAEAGTLDVAREFWRERLAGDREPLALPADFPRPAVQTFAGAHVEYEIPPPVLSALERLAASHRATLFMTLLAATRVLLFRYTGQSDLIIGTPVSGRPHADLEDQVGFYVNLVPLRLLVRPFDSFATVIERVRDVALQSYAQEYPFDRLVDDLDLARDLSRAPLFDVLLAWEEHEEAPQMLGQVRVEPFAFDAPVAKYDLTFFFSRSRGSVRVTVNYSTALFRRERVEGLLRHLGELLTHVVSDETLLVRELRIASEDELGRVQREFSGAATPYPRAASIVEMFDARVSASPDAIAVVAQRGDGVVTHVSYGELQSRATRVAAGLNAMGVGLESPVGILLERSERIPVALIGTLQAGGCYVPLDAASPRERLAFVSTDAGCVVVLTDASTRARLGIQVGHRLGRASCVDIDDLSAVAVPLTPAARAKATGRNLAYIMYTSGSTGAPKGTLIEQRSVLRLVLNTNFVQLRTGDRVLQTGSLAFDASTFEIWGPLLNGGSVCFAPAEDMLVASSVRELITRHGITAMWATASLLNQWVETDIDVIGGLRVLLAGGERLSPGHMQRVRQRHRDVQLINGYGPTENTTFSTCHHITDVGARDIPIGRPIANSEVYVLDAWGHLCAIGVPGEICAGGDGLARGYLGRADVTAERFVPHPFRAGERLYRTGDLGRWNDDGTLEFLGRGDQQVKVRGYRIELGEIEACLQAHPAVKQCVVVARESASGPRELVAYVVTAAPVSRGELREHLARTLPDYMLPARILSIDRLPLTANGKLDRAQLPAADADSDARNEHQAPRSATERALGAIWNDVLDRTGVGIYDNFFELGGHSLKATRVLSRIHRELSDRITLRDLFSAPTIAALALRIEERGGSRGTAILRVPDADRYRASHAQQRLWVLDRLSGESAAYNVPGAVTLEGVLDLESLSGAFSRLVARHESLRTSFLEVDGTLYQQVQPPFPVNIPVIDVSAQPDPDAAARELALADAAERFVLTEAPLFRVKVIRTAPSRHVCFFNLHHIITDGWSMRVLLGELLAFYRELTHGDAARLPDLAIQYRDYAAWQRAFLESADADVHRRYWMELYRDDVPPLDLPGDAPRPAIQSFRGGTVRCQFDAPVVSRLRRLGREYDATLYMVWLALVRVLLRRHAGQDEFVLGTGVSGREHADLAGQVGFYVNMLPLRQRVTASDTFAETLRHTREIVSAALEHQAYPFDALVHDLKLRRELGRQPLFDVVVTLEEEEAGNAAASGRLAALVVTPFEFASPFSKFDLMFAFNCTADGGCDVALEYSTELFRADRIERLAGQLTQLVASALADPSARVTALEMLPPGERRQLAQFAASWSSYPADATVVEVFETQASRHPDRPAVAGGGTVLSYRELNTRANALAWQLRAHGVRPEQPVGVLLDRSERVATALVGILKAGGCYVPLDPGAPSERLAFMVADAGCPVVVGEGHTLLAAGDPGHWLGAARWVDIDQVTAVETSAAVDPPRVSGATGRSLAYVMYTSGSTGRPKGTLIEQRSVLRLVIGSNYLQLTPDDRVLQTGSLAFDASTLEIWGPLLNGGCVCFAPADTLLDADRVAAAIAGSGVTAMFITTSLFNQLVDAEPAVFAKVRTVMTGGEKVSVAHINRVRRRLPGLSLLHVYGPTENTTFTTFYTVAREHEQDVPIGKPLANTSVYVLDDVGGLCPIGVPGEICTGGDGLARGYLGRPDLTAERFVPSGWRPGERLYRTGDVGRWSADGDLEFLGRRDHQVKIRGYRVEPEEIEVRLLQHPAVTQAAVLTRETTVGTRALVAYYAGGDQATVTDVRAHLARTLPAYMVPSEIVRRDRLPLNRSGKVDRAALAARPEPTPEVGHATEPPRTDQERALAAVWQAVLGCERVGRHDHYFDAGGDSIRAIQIVNRLRKAGWSFDVRDVFECPVLCDAATRLSLPVAAGARDPVVGPLPLTPIQRWFFGRAGDLHHFNHAVLLHVPDRLDVATLRTAIGLLWERHAALRLAVMRDEDGAPTALDDVTSRWSLDDLFRVRDVAADQEWQADAEQVQAAFDLDRGPLFKAVLYRRAAGDRLLLVAHHLIVDGVSWRILLDDLQQAYADLESGEPPVLTQQVHSYAEWVHALVSRAGEMSWRAAHQYWSSVCRERGSVIERDVAGGDAILMQTYGDCRSVDVSLSQEVTGRLLGHVHATFNTTADDFLLTAVGRAIRTLCGGERVWIAMEGHGRDALPGIDVSGTVGWFTSVYPFLLSVASDEPIEQLRQVKESLRTARRHAVAYGALRWLGASPALDVPAPDCRLSVNYMGQIVAGRGSGSFRWAAEGAGTVIAPSVEREQDFEIGGLVLDDALTLSVTYNARLHTESTARRLLDGIATELTQLLVHCERASGVYRTPSDFTACSLSLPAFDRLVEKHGWTAAAIEDVYPLTPMQEGLLFQTLMDQSSRAYFLQLNYRMTGALDVDRFRRAWDDVAHRHAVLRAAIVYEDVDRPMQVILRDRRPEVMIADLSGLAEIARDARIDEWRRQDMARGVDLQHDSLMRLAIFRLGPALHHIVWSYHHVVLDGWSLGVIYRELLETYQRLRDARPALPPPQPFSRFVRWLLDQDAGRAGDFWRDYLRGYEPRPLVAPLASALAAACDQAAGTETGEYTLTFSPQLSQQLRAIAADTGVTLNTVVQTIWGLLLARYTGTREVVCGAVVSGRPAGLPGVEDMIGLFINTVPVRISVLEGESFRDALRRLQRDVLGAEPFHYFPLAEIQAAHGAERALFDHVIVFENYPLDSVAEPGGDERDALRVETFEAHDRTHYDLDLTVVPGAQLHIRFNYNPLVFTGDGVQRLAEQYQTLASAAVGDPELPAARLPWCTAAEEDAVLAAGRGPRRIYPLDTPLAVLFERRAASCEHAVAVTCGGQATTYAELNARANRIAHWLRAVGVVRGDVVALLDRRGIDLIASMMAVLKAGGVFLPVDPDYPLDRVRYMLRDSAAKIVITRRSVWATLGGDAATTRSDTADARVLDLDREALNGYATDNPAASGSGRDAAYLLYTSGSTGRPKGAVIRNDGAVNHIFAQFECLRFHAGSVFLQSAPCSSDIAVWQCLAPGLIGGRVVVAEQDVVLDPARLFAVIKNDGVTIFELVPVVLKALLDYVATLSPEDRRLPSLEWAMVTGESVPVALVNRWLALYPDIPLVNAYGPTEAADDISQAVISTPLPADAHTVPIGRPLPNLRLYVLDEAQRPLPFGVTGEICVSGCGVGAGYWGDDERTAAAFIHNPFAEDEQHAVMYRTGDRGRWRKDGTLECLGRIDQQVKVRGVRMELEEIESRMLEYPEVRQAAAAVRDVAGEPTLVAWFVGSASTAALREHLRERLPAAMVPSFLLPLDALPLTPAGKIDRKACPDPEPARAREEHVFVAPRTDIERQLVAIWRDVLQVPRVGVRDNFFALGGHSLKAMQAVSRIHRDLGVHVPLPVFFRCPTVEALGASVQGRGADAFVAALPAPPAPDYALSHAQKRLWLQHHLEGDVAYNMPEAVLLEEPLDSAALERAFATLLERHEVLRTAFVTRDGEPRQRIEPSVSFTIRHVDLTDIPATDAERRAASLAAAEAATPFDLSRPPLLRATLYRLAPSRAVFLMVIHHIVGDGWSMNVLYREVLALYDAYRQDRPNPLPPLRIQYKDFALWQNQQDFTRHEQYWLSTLAGVPDGLRLPYDSAVDGDRDFSGKIEVARLDAATRTRLLQLANAHGTTLSSVVLALFQLVLYQWTRQGDFCVGVALANRNRAELENLIGFFVNVLPIRVQLSSDMEFLALLADVSARTQEAFEFQEYPFDRLVERMNPDRHGNRQPLVNVIYAFQNYEDVAIDVGAPARSAATEPAAGALVRPFAVPFETSKFDLTLFVSDVDDELQLSLEYDTRLFRRDTVRRVLTAIERFARMVA